jgi:hypothetical protein
VCKQLTHHRLPDAGPLGRTTLCTFPFSVGHSTNTTITCAGTLLQSVVLLKAAVVPYISAANGMVLFASRIVVEVESFPLTSISPIIHPPTWTSCVTIDSLYHGQRNVAIPSLILLFLSSAPSFTLQYHGPLGSKHCASGNC